MRLLPRSLYDYTNFLGSREGLYNKKMFAPFNPYHLQQRVLPLGIQLYQRQSGRHM